MSSIRNTVSTLTSVTRRPLTGRRFKLTGRVRFTGKASKVSASTLGQRLELSHSISFHAEGFPLLISPDLLRKRDLGQIDLSRMQKKSEWLIEIAEVKSSSVGEDAFARGQRKRLIAAGNFLSGIFGAPVKFIRLVG